MKVGVIGAVPFNLIFGGGETQTINTMQAIKKRGIDIDYYDLWNKDYSCDIVHIFGCHDWLYKWASLAKDKGYKIALSTIAYSQTRMNYKRKAYDIFDSMLPIDTAYRMNRKLIQLADVLLPNSEEEGRYLDEILGASNKKKIVVPNATDLRYKNADKTAFIKEYGLDNFVLCVGKIEPRKNQLNLVKALAGTDIPLVILGSYIPNDKNYYNDVIKIINENNNMHHIEFLPYDSDMLSSIYAAARVHVLLGASETPGIVNLEAGLAGANLIVGDCKPVREYLGNYATYVDYNNLKEIRESVIKIYCEPRTRVASSFIEKNYTWDVVAKKTIEAYEMLMRN